MYNNNNVYKPAENVFKINSRVQKYNIFKPSYKARLGLKNFKNSEEM